MQDHVNEAAGRILLLRSAHPTRVAVDGFCGAGKTMFAAHLANQLAASHRPIIQATTDDFQHPPEIRWQLGERSPRGFYLHAIDVDSLRTELLEPLGPGGTRRYRTSTYDMRSMQPNRSPVHVADLESILIVDGLFLLTAGLRSCWDFSIFIDASVDTCIARARLRNQERQEDADAVEALYRERYVPGFQLYLDQDRPKEVAGMVVRNEQSERLKPAAELSRGSEHA
jgi:uridine kinase